MTGFVSSLQAASARRSSLLCIGLDTDWQKLPKAVGSGIKGALKFNKAIIDATSEFACAYKLNLAFYLVHGKAGIELLDNTLHLIPSGVVKIVDAKFGDIGNTAASYAKFAFETLQANAVTVNPYMGEDSVRPFLEHSDRGAFILCRTSNQGAKDFQDFGSGPPLFQAVAKRVASWNERGNCGLVVGATWPAELETIRKIVGEQIPILIPGVGAQGGDLQAAVRLGANSHGELALINVSRSILYANVSPDFASAARAEAQSLRDSINTIRNAT